jgi:hypothetical protein
VQQAAPSIVVWPVLSMKELVSRMFNRIEVVLSHNYIVASTRCSTAVTHVLTASTDAHVVRYAYCPVFELPSGNREGKAS